jgi:parallel beta-helix repeat protein
MNKTISILNIILLFILSAKSSTYYVSVSGDNSGDGNYSSPWRTIQYGISHLNAGDSLLVLAGSYTGFYVNINGNESQRIVIKAVGNVNINDPVTYQGRLAGIHVTASYITIDGFEISGINSGDRGIRVSSGISEGYLLRVIVKDCFVHHTGSVGISTSYAHNFLAENNEVSSSGTTHGIYLTNSGDYPVLRNNIVHDNEKAGIQLNADMEMPGDHIISNALIEGNTLYRNNSTGSGGAITMASVRDSKIQNNLFYDNYKTGIAMWDDGFGEQWGCKNDTIINNTIVIPASSQKHGISIRNGSTDAVIRNNILIHEGSHDSYAVDPESFSGLDSDYNVVTRFEDTNEALVSLETWQSKYNLDMNSFTALSTETFKNLGDHKFELKSTSPAIDSGDGNFAPQFDFYGRSRFDIPDIENKGTGAIDYSDRGAVESIGENTVPKPPQNLRITN